MAQIAVNLIQDDLRDDRFAVCVAVGHLVCEVLSSKRNRNDLLGEVDPSLPADVSHTQIVQHLLDGTRRNGRTSGLKRHRHDVVGDWLSVRVCGANDFSDRNVHVRVVLGRQP